MDPKCWADGEEAIRKLSSPAAIQAFLDALPYNPGETGRSPLKVLHERTANCMEGALFAAACLELIGHSPRILNFAAVRDDDHVIAIYQRSGYFGSIAKSNYTGLRYRNPVYRTLRELVLSYFEHHFNRDGELTMRRYTRPIDLSTSQYGGWQIAEDIEFLSEALDAQPHTSLLPPEGEAVLRLVDDKLLEAGLFGADPSGLYQT